MKSLTLAALAVTIALTSVPVRAHFTEPVPEGWDSWAMRQVAIWGNRCCDPSDVYLYKGAWRYEYEGGEITGVTIMFDTGMEVFVPQRNFVDRTRNPDDLNPTGSAVIWYRDITNMYCFDPPGALG